MRCARTKSKLAWLRVYCGDSIEPYLKALLRLFKTTLICTQLSVDKAQVILCEQYL